jgi:predicted small integral membrane protein
MSGEPSDGHISQKRRAGMAGWRSDRPGLVSSRQDEQTTKGFQRHFCLVLSRYTYIGWVCLVSTARLVGLARRDTLPEGKLRRST